MKKTKAEIVYALLVTLMWLCSQQVLFGQDSIAITVLHTNDMHGQLLGATDGPCPVPAWYEIIRETREGDESPYEDTILVDGGDLFEGSALDFLTRGKMMVDALSVLGYDCWTLGNHDFWLGRDELAQRVREARYGGVAVLGANIIDERSLRCAEDLALPYRLVERDGVKIAIIGLAHPGTRAMNHQSLTKGLQFADPIVAIRALARRLDGADATIVVGHLGIGRRISAKSLASLPGSVKVLIDGHSHVETAKPRRVRLDDGSTLLIVQAGSKLQSIGKLTLHFATAGMQLLLDEQRAVSCEYELISIRRRSKTSLSMRQLAALDIPLPSRADIRTGRASPNAVAAFFIDRHAKAHLPSLARSAGFAAVELARPSLGRPDPFGNILCDSLRNCAITLHRQGKLAGLAQHCDETSFAQRLVAVASPCSIRGQIPQGAHIDYDTLFRHLPFDNALHIIALSGRELRTLIDGARWWRGGIISSGLKAVINKEAPRGKRVKQMTINGDALAEDELYFVATSDFIATGQAGWRHSRLQDNQQIVTNLSTRETLFDYLASRHPGTIGLAENEMRITVE